MLGCFNTVNANLIERFGLERVVVNTAEWIKAAEAHMYGKNGLLNHGAKNLITRESERWAERIKTRHNENPALPVAFTPGFADSANVTVWTEYLDYMAKDLQSRLRASGMEHAFDTAEGNSK